jgi:hypothetical protein
MISPETSFNLSTEEGNQKALFCWAAMNAKQFPELDWLYHVPNGEQRSAMTGAKLKLMGVRPGYPDIGLDVARKGGHGLRIELKKHGGKVSSLQQGWICFLKEQGYAVHVAFGWEHARDILLDYLA